MVALFVKFLPLVAIGLVHGSSVPSILISGPRIAIEFRKVELRCSTGSKDNSLQWYFSSDGSDAQYEPRIPSSSVRLSRDGATLTIRSVTNDHVGSYRCCSSETVCARLKLFVVSVTDDDSSLEPIDSAAGSAGMLDVQSHGSFSLALYHAPINAEIYIDRKPTVSFCDHFLKYARECYENRSSDTVSYYVRNATMEASGQFAIKVLHNQQLEQFRLNILIRGAPTVHMNNYNVLSSSTHINLECRGYGYPTPNITFSYTPCNPLRMDHLDGLRIKHSNESTTIPQHLARHSVFNYTTSFEVIVPSWPIENGPGIVTCQAWSSQGTSSTGTFLYVRNFLDTMLFSVVSPTDVVLYGDMVNMACQVDVYNFTNQFIVSHSGNHDSRIGERTAYAWTVMYRTYITNASQNVISCVAHNKNGSVLVKTLNLRIRYPSKPHIVSVNDTVNITIASGDRHKLECDIEGTPTPNIVWFKNDDHLRSEQGYVILISLEPDEIGATYKCIGASRLGKAIKTWHIVVEGVIKLKLDETSIRINHVSLLFQIQRSGC
ncbi:vascular endothelial growth factor receptor 1-like [Anopheles moucheti]|uniref:vascular endothelial growth factor receptor 1-like n=1 Tax=Anopheles moucheti TaxID=186751 RepID=UPI0022F0A6EC|nr:vascular endothelial growth factor receptor 1-like [Anopheles moucheti]